MLRSIKAVFYLHLAFTYGPSGSYDSKISQIISKWHVPLSTAPCNYGQHTNDFGLEIKKLLISNSSQEQGWFKLKYLIQNLENVAQKLGIATQKTKRVYPVRDHIFRLRNGEIRKQCLSDHLDKALERAHSKGFYFNETGVTRLKNSITKVEGGIAHRLALKTVDEVYNLFSNPNTLNQYAEGGNMFVLTNRKGEIRILAGRDHLYGSLNLYRLDKNFLEKLTRMFPAEQYTNRISQGLKAEKIYSVAEKMYAQGNLKLDNATGLMDFEKISKVIQSVEANKGCLDTFEKEEHPYRKMAVQMGLVKPFSLDKAYIEKCRPAVANYLFQKYMIHKIMATDFKVEPEEMQFLPQVLYHLDTFIKPGPKNSVFVANFALNVEIMEALLTEAEALKLSPQDRKLAMEYLHAAQEMDKKLSPLMEIVCKKIAQADLTVVPMPGLFFHESEAHKKTYNFNFMNAISGWSAKTGKYFYITSGAQAGDRLGEFFMDIFTKFLESYQPDLDVFYIGHPPENPKDFSEAMEGWNDLNFQAGVHCFSFETETASHIG